MKFEVEVDGCIVVCNTDSLRADSKYLYGNIIEDEEEFDEELNKEEIDEEEFDDLGSGYYMSQEEFDKAKQDFYNKIDNIDADFIKSKLQGKLQFTKKGNLDKRKTILLIESGIISSYSNEYGSHNYKVPSILVTPNGDKTMIVYYSNRSQQDSF